MIADAAGTPLYIVHVSCEQAHEAIRRARQKGMRVFGEPLIQHLTLDESEYFNKDWQYAARRVMSRRSGPRTIRTVCGPGLPRGLCRWSQPTTRRSTTNRSGWVSTTSP